MENKITVKEAARLIGTSEMFIRIGLQRNILPFGVAMKCLTVQSILIIFRRNNFINI